MELIYLDLEDERPGFIEDPTFNVIPDIEDFFDVDFDFGRVEHLGHYNKL